MCSGVEPGLRAHVFWALFFQHGLGHPAPTHLHLSSRVIIAPLGMSCICLLLVLIALSKTVGLVYDTEDYTSQCIANPSVGCNPDAPCTSSPRPHRSCLATPIPAWTVPFRRMQCCFRCCLRHWIQHYGFDQNHAFHNPMIANCSYNANSTIDPYSVLMGYNTPTTFADLVKWWKPGRKWGNDLRVYASTSVVRSGIITLQQTGSPYYILLFSCVIPKNLTGKLVFIAGGGVFPKPQYRQYMAHPNARWFAQEVHAPPAVAEPPDMSLVTAMPIGLLQPEIWPPLLTGGEVNLSDRPALLYCGGRMGNQGRGGRRQKIAMLRANGFNCPVDVVPAKTYIKSLATYKFVVSPFGAEPNNFRDWEALVAGSIPLLDDHPPHYELWRGMPAVFVKDWSKVTPQFLERKYLAILAQREQGELFVHKGYAPYWIHALTEHLPAVRGAKYRLEGEEFVQCKRRAWGGV